MGHKRARHRGGPQGTTRAAGAAEDPVPPAPARAQPRPPESTRSPRTQILLGSILLLAGAGLHLAWRVDPALRFDLVARPFFTDGPFFWKFHAVPGGLLDYAAAWAAQVTGHPWLGPWLLAGLLACLFLAARRVLAAVPGPDPTGAAWLFIALAAALPGRYEAETERTVLGLLVALCAGAAWLEVPGRLPRLRWAVCWLLAGVLFWMAGTLPATLFAAVAALGQWLGERRPWTALGCGLAMLLGLLWKTLRPSFQPFATVGQWGDGLTLALHGALHLFVPAWLFLGVAVVWWQGTGRGLQPGRFHRWALLAACCALIGACVDPSRRTLAQLAQSTHRREWDRARTAAANLHAWTATARLQLVRTLHHTGRLPDDLFCYPQQRGWDLLPAYDVGLEMCGAQADTLLELGQVNLAEHMAHEALELEGPRPAMLGTLATINILQGRPEAARMFLRRLRLVPFHQKDADRALQALAEDPAGVNRPTLAAIRARIPRSDEPEPKLPTDTLLRQLLQSNPTNRMAFDYLIAHDLLTSQFDALVADLARLDTFGQSTLARPCEEALLFHQSQTRGSALDLHGRRISDASQDRFRRFTEASRRVQGQPAAARAALASEFGDTFWFYHLFGESAAASTSPALRSRLPFSPVSHRRKGRPGAKPRPARSRAIGDRAWQTQGGPRWRSPARRFLLVLLGTPLIACSPAPGLFHPDQATAVPRPPRVHPDSADAVIPPNIAPLSFVVDEPARDYRVRIHGASGTPIDLASSTGAIVIPPEPWRNLLAANTGSELIVEVFARQTPGGWQRFMPTTNRVAREPIDPTLVYRLLKPLYNFFTELGIYQRDLEGHRQVPVLENRDFGGGCLNCHTFLNRRPDTFALHIRGVQGPQPMLLAQSNAVARVDRTAGYLSWHPSGHLLAFSANKLSLFFHTLGETRDVFDAESNLGVYWTDSNVVSAPPPIARPDRLETWPSWSPDGRHLYFCSGPKLRRERYRQVRYDLMRIAFDLDTKTWGEPEVLVSGADSGLSASQPRVSPDGRWLLFCLAKYGHFPVYQPSSDLYLMDLATRQRRRLEVNSDQSDSWHCWSSNSRWVVFSSKRGNGLFARPHFSYVDDQGRFQRSFVLPQQDPSFYDSCIQTFNVPEFVQGPIRIEAAELARAVVKPRHTLTPSGEAHQQHREEQSAPLTAAPGTPASAPEP